MNRQIQIWEHVLVIIEDSTPVYTESLTWLSTKCGKALVHNSARIMRSHNFWRKNILEPQLIPISLTVSQWNQSKNDCSISVQGSERVRIHSFTHTHGSIRSYCFSDYSFNSLIAKLLKLCTKFNCGENCFHLKCKSVFYESS